MRLIDKKCKGDCHKIFGIDPDFNAMPNCWDNGGNLYSARKFYEAGWKACREAFVEHAKVHGPCALSFEELLNWGEEDEKENQKAESAGPDKQEQ